MAFDINTDEFIKLTAKLGSLPKQFLPSAVRNTLNDAAFDTKRNVPKTAEEAFTVRRKVLFGKRIKVDRARGWDINTMAATTGFDDSGMESTGDGLEAQETGGTIRSSKLIPHNKGRISGSYNRVMKTKHRLGSISVSTPKNKRKGSKYLLLKKGGKGTVFEIQKRARGSKLMPVYTYVNKKRRTVKKSPFMLPAAMIARNKIPAFYKSNAEFQIKKYWN